MRNKNRPPDLIRQKALVGNGFGTHSKSPHFKERVVLFGRHEYCNSVVGLCLNNQSKSLVNSSRWIYGDTEPLMPPTNITRRISLYFHGFCVQKHYTLYASKHSFREVYGNHGEFWLVSHIWQVCYDRVVEGTVARSEGWERLPVEHND